LEKIALWRVAIAHRAGRRFRTCPVAERSAGLEAEVDRLRRSLALLQAFVDAETRQRNGIELDEIRRSAAVRPALAVVLKPGRKAVRYRITEEHLLLMQAAVACEICRAAFWSGYLCGGLLDAVTLDEYLELSYLGAPPEEGLLGPELIMELPERFREEYRARRAFAGIRAQISH
jgi:hypothetical protein